MIHAIVLIEAERGAMADLGGALADVHGVAEAWSVTGEWDFVAMLRVRSAEEIAEVVAGRIAQVPGSGARRRWSRSRCSRSTT
ncbi:MAG: Lrp/AsnC family transcriptional regulator [Solirubrobacteraceae bacterium]